MSKNEKNTEEYVRNWLKGQLNITFDEQKSRSSAISKLLSSASKNGKGNIGNPEFIVTSPQKLGTIMVIECKASIADHQSNPFDPFNYDSNITNAAKYAVDGALHYAKYLKKSDENPTGFENVIAIAVSGEDSYVATTFINDERFDELKTFEEAIAIIDFDPEKKKKTEKEVMSFAKDLHNYMRDELAFKEELKPLMVSAALLGLQDNTFKKTYTAFAEGESRDELADHLLQRIESVLKSANIPLNKVSTILSELSFIKNNVHLQQLDKKENKSKLYVIIKNIDDHMVQFMKENSGVDILGRFYGEFIRYTGGDGKGLGIVLTPNHITDLMTDLVGINRNSIVLDTCTGTGAFLIKAMKKMIDDAKNAKEFEKIEQIKSSQLIGVEMNSSMYVMGAANMIFRGDGKSNLHNMSCFDAADFINPKDQYGNEIRRRPSVAVINPPYSQKGSGLKEIDFIEFTADQLEHGGLLAAIVPMSVAIGTQKNDVIAKEQLLRKHSLIAVMSMPDELFYPTGVVTCIIVLRAHMPHDSSEDGIPTWFGFWKEDGFVKTRTNGRIDINDNWHDLKRSWLRAFRNREVHEGQSVQRIVTAEDEWCAEAYMETDYSLLTKADFEKVVKDYALFKISNQAGDYNEND